jgi:alginate O-acetyltransferase complex protein AlgI
MNVSEFWRRWHISLSTWLRDYLFIPLGGSRTDQSWQTTRNLMVTMTLGGLWHGAATTFIIWGFVHGSLLVLHRRFQNLAARRPRLAAALDSVPGRGLSILVTFISVSLAWVLFRSSSLHDATLIWARLFVPHGGSSVPYWRQSLVVLGGVVALGHVAGRYDLCKRLERRFPAPMLGLGYAAAAAITLLLAPDASKAFIYFQF